ncbi:SpaA isopeptide-forming pilin-related protein [uncultured Holdemanella sp.]|uniref:SpaA isopeptide-forming pilin-related protein n=1 Tax=uncultured Holdemanella sp. TaxID=1763549 RepID=UPI0025900DFB|nr:SpaA isopeptide-forming pilin-related protein [uncultured Holdemanella sp.]
MVSEYIKKLLKDKARLKKWKRITLALSCVVVFCVVYALTLPAITLEGKTICGMEEHTHTEECFQDDKLICDKEEHQHTEDCYEKEEEQPVEEENTQPDTTEPSDEVETVAEPENNKQDESNEEEQQQESPQVTSADFDLSAHPSNIKNITLSYKDSNGNWVNIDSNGNQIIPGNAKIKLNVDYFNINIDQLISTDEYSQCITYIIPDLLSNAQTVGIITQDSEEVGKLAVQNGVVSLKFKNEYLKQLQKKENSSLTGDFYVEGDVNLSKLYPDGHVTVITGNKTYNLNFGPDVFAQYGDLKIEKTLANDKVISVNGEDYLSYTIKVTTGNVGCPDVKVVDTFTRNQDLVTYVGVTTNKKDLVGNPHNQEPYETIVNGKQHGSVYLGTTSSDATPIPGENTKKDNETGSLVWAIGDMSANETRILTYFVKLKENEPLNKKGAISNNANVYSKTYPRHSSNAPFNPIVSYGMNKKQEGSTIRNEDGSYTINYKLDFTLNSNSNYPLKDFEIMDYLDYSEDHYVDEKIRGYVSYNKDSFKVSVQKSNGTKKELEENEYKLAWAKGDTNYKTEWDNKKDGNPTRFKITGSDKNPITVDPGDSYYVTYSVTVQPEALAVMKSDSVQISNRYLVNASNAKHEYRGWDFLDRVARDLSVGEYKWDEKKVEEPIAVSQEIKMSGNVYDDSFKSDTTDKFTVPAGSYPYVVTVNDTKGVWDATEVKMTDTLSPQNMAYVGYAKVEAFEYIKDSNSYSPVGTKWVKINGLNTFTLSPKQIGWDNKDYKYVFTYYAKPVNLENYSKTQVTNTFVLNGIVKKGNISIDISNINSSKTVEFSGSYNMNVRKSSWYYQEPEPDAQTWENGALYWVIEVSGTSIKEDTVFKDSIVKNSDKEEDKLSYLHDDSLVGIYKGTSIDNFKTIDDFNKNANMTDVRNSFDKLTFTGANGNYDSLEITVKNKIPLNENEKVFMIVKSEPSVRPTNYRDAFNFSNKVSTKDDGINFMDRSTATKTLYCGGDILKELGQTFQYNKESSKIKTIVADKDVNIPAGSESRIYKDGLNETGSGIYASWVFKLNLAGDLSGSYRVLDNIPDGMQLAYMRIKWIGAEQKKIGPIVSKPIGNLNGWTEKSTTANDDDNESRETIYYVKGNQALIELGDFYPGKVNDLYSVDVQVVCKVTDSNVLLGNKEKEFMNTVVLQTRDGNDITSASSPVKMKISNLDKSYIPVTENNKNTNKVNFTINTNQLGQQLPNNEGSKLKLIDKLSDTLILDTSSIKAVKTGTEEAVDINASLGEDNTLEIELPNGIPVTITYTATVNAAPGQTVGFSNEAYWKNYSSSGQKVGEENYSYEAGGTVSGAQNPVLKITKKDKKHLNKLLAGATFKMVECEMNEGNIQETNTSWQGTTDKNGNLELGTGTNLMQYNTIYKVTEEKAPDGYVDEKYSCYIMVVKDDGNEKYKTYKDHKEWYSDVKIQYQSTYELTVTNHKGEITVEKKFLNVAGHDSNPVSGTYKFGLYKDKNAVDKPIQTIEITYNTRDLNTNSEKFEDLDLNETYYVYELDDQNNPIKDSGVHVINKLEYITSYSTNNAVQSGATVTVTNQSRVKQLPSTGGYGSLLYRISGAVLVLASLIFLTNINKKNHLNDKSKNRRKK